MWDMIDAAKAGDPRNPYVNSKSSTNTQDIPQPDGSARTCPNRPTDACVDEPHAYDRFSNATLKRGKAVSKQFDTLLHNLPLVQGTPAGVQAVDDVPYPWPHENLHRSDGDAGNDHSHTPNEKYYFMLPDNTTANRITKFHNFCKELPDVMCNYCSITLYPEDVKWVTLRTPDNGVPSACRASAANAHVPGIQGYTDRSKRTQGGRQQYAFCTSHASEDGRQEWVFDDVGAMPQVLACLTPPERRATALLRMRCCMFKGGGGVGNGYTILKGAAEYVPADFNGSVGQITSDLDKTKDIRPEKVNAALQWLLQHNPLVAKGTRTRKNSLSLLGGNRV